MLSIEHEYYINALAGVRKEIISVEDFDNLKDTWFCFLVLTDGRTITGICKQRNILPVDSRTLAKEDALRRFK